MVMTYNPVLPMTGQTALNLMFAGPYSTARVFVAFETAALDALYHVKLGLGRIPAVEEI